MRKLLLNIAVLICIHSLLPERALAQEIEVIIDNIRSEEGVMVIGVYRDEAGFKEDSPYLRNKYSKSMVNEGSMTVTIKLDPGTYGLALLDDENNDDKMNFSLIGVPREGYGFSDYVHSGLSRPKFRDFSFTLEEGETLEVTCLIKYL